MTAPTTRETADHAELALLAEAATPGPWKACGTIYEHMNCEVRGGAKGEGQAIAQVWDGPNAFRDGQFIAAANPAIVLALLSEIAALRGERDHFEAEFRRQCGATADQMGLSERAAHELDAVSDAIGTVRFMDPPDGGDVPLSEQVRRMSSALTQAERQRDELRKALEPFATYPLAVKMDGTVAPDEYQLTGRHDKDGIFRTVTNGDFQRARQALANQGADQ